MTKDTTMTLKITYFLRLFSPSIGGKVKCSCSESELSRSRSLDPSLKLMPVSVIGMWSKRFIIRLLISDVSEKKCCYFLKCLVTINTMGTALKNKFSFKTITL